ncbi:hypothetical protein Pla52n_19640 [Stieleria varia]|uniref:Bacteriophage T5 Orf172 DNA-binding domain-containing protein n=2 Tax=Stieleria varia TaxID=2528005 RepID=A0A5C6B281_9BACT|nr:hypothetical protein Pla52n_19640 [Stieleria varia]
MDSEQKVARFCSECGQRVVAASQTLEKPQICPKCKTRVYFLDYSRDPIPSLEKYRSEGRQRDPDVDRKLAAIVAAGTIAILFIAVIAVLFSQITIFFVLAGICLIVGIVAISLSLDIKSRVVAANTAIDELQRRTEFHEHNQAKLIGHAMGFQKNFRELIETENLRLQQQFELILEEAKVDRERAARELENAKEYASAASEISKRLFTEVRKSIKSKLTPNNYAIQKHRFQKMVEFCEKKGYPIEQDVILQFEAELKSDYEEAVRSQLAKEEQARIKEKLREELRAERELEQELKRAEADRIAIEKAIAEALARTHDEHSAEVEVLRQKLSEAEARSQRAQSMAQLTKAGHVYVISNIGSFGEGVFKIGLTRRLQPMDRIIELGDASVPFPFDVHMMISSSDAPALEAALHRRFKRQRVNRVNLRKEFFRVSIESIAEVVKEFQGDVDYVASPEALEYNETLQMSDEDFEFVSSQVDIESLPEE